MRFIAVKLIIRFSQNIIDAIYRREIDYSIFPKYITMRFIAQNNRSNFPIYIDAIYRPQNDSAIFPQ
jgi:hypothetical protein